MKTFAFIATMIFATVANATTVKNNTKNAEAAPATVEVAKSNARSMVQTDDNGISYKYDYIMDADGRVVNKLISAWNSDKSSWTPLSAYSVVYTQDETVLSYARYNAETKTYSKNVQQARYNATDYPVIISCPECCK